MLNTCPDEVSVIVLFGGIGFLQREEKEEKRAKKKKEKGNTQYTTDSQTPNLEENQPNCALSTKALCAVGFQLLPLAKAGISGVVVPKRIFLSGVVVPKQKMSVGQV